MQRTSGYILTARIITVVSLFIPVLLIAGAGLGKVIDPFPAGIFVTSSAAIPFGAAIKVAYWAGWAELGLCLVILLSLGRQAAVISALVLMVAFLGMLWRVSQLPGAAGCGCFGAIMGIWFPDSIAGQMKIDLAIIGLLLAHLLALQFQRRLPSEKA